MSRLIIFLLLVSICGMLCFVSWAGCDGKCEDKCKYDDTSDDDTNDDTDYDDTDDDTDDDVAGDVDWETPVIDGASN